jgi:UDP-glucose 4,6-dehydratase
MSKVIISGGAGFIGSHVCEVIYKNFNISKMIIIDKLTYAGNLVYIKELLKNKNVEFIHDDILNIYKYKKKFLSFDISINLAAESHVDNSFTKSLLFTKTNTLGAHTFLHCSIENNVKKIVHVSTDEVYGQKLSGLNYEDDDLNPTNPYSASKAAAEIIINSYRHFNPRKILIVRGNNIYGVNQNVEKLIPACISSLLKNKKIQINGDGEHSRCFLSAWDFSEAIVMLLKKNMSGIYNIGNNKEYKNIHIAKTICKLMNKNPDKNIVFIKDRLFNDKRYAISLKKIYKLGWKPKRKLLADLPDIIEWYKNNIHLFNAKKKFRINKF